MVKKISASMPGTCGELVQGTIDGRNLLISCPIDMWSEITLYPDYPLVYSHQLKKVRHAIGYVKRLQQSSESAGVLPKVVRRSVLTPGKGMGSSTADVVAAYYAACLLWVRQASVSEAADIALQIEPSDSTMFSGLTIFDHIHGQRREVIGNAPELDIIMIDPGGFINTTEFHKKHMQQAMSQAHAEQVRMALQYVVDGIRSNDIEQIAKGATISAYANQALLPKKHLHEVMQLCEQLGGLGINVAHSGTVIGILLEPGRISGQAAWEYVKQRYPAWNVYPTKLISGGVRIGEQAI